jgi:hypothetical protein
MIKLLILFGFAVGLISAVRFETRRLPAPR